MGSFVQARYVHWRIVGKCPIHKNTLVVVQTDRQRDRQTDRQGEGEREREIYRTYLERGGVPELTMLVSSEGKIYKCRGRVHLTDDVFTPTRVSLLLN